MAKGKPDHQHEMVASAIAFGLSLAYPAAKITLGTKIADLKLKPDVFIDHCNGKQWAYEVVNKNAAVDKIVSKHKQYQTAGVYDYWIVSETLSPEKPISEDALQQSVWLFEEPLPDHPPRFKMNRNLQQVLLQIGNGNLYTFMLNKPLLELADHWQVQMALMGVAIYRQTPKNDAYVELAEDMIPLPHLVFGDDGQPRKMEGIPEGSPVEAQSLLNITPDKPVFASDIIDGLNEIMQPEAIQTLIIEALQQAAEAAQGIEIDPHSEAVENFQNTIAQLTKNPPQTSDEALLLFSSINQLLSFFPEDVRADLEIFFRPLQEMQRLMKWKKWFQSNDHFLALTKKINLGDTQ